MSRSGSGSGSERSLSELLEDLDLDAARQEESTTPIEERDRCPLCYSVNVQPRSPSISSRGSERLRSYRCLSCEHRFEDPIQLSEEPRAVGRERLRSDRYPESVEDVESDPIRSDR